MQQITMYKASDGKLFEFQESCAQHEREIAFRAKLKEWINSWFYHGIEEHEVVDIIFHTLTSPKKEDVRFWDILREAKTCQ